MEEEEPNQDQKCGAHLAIVSLTAVYLLNLIQFILAIARGIEQEWLSTISFLSILLTVANHYYMLRSFDPFRTFSMNLARRF